MPKIGTFSKQKEQNPTDINFDGLVAEWQNRDGYIVSILVRYDITMRKPEYWLAFEYENNGGAGPDIGHVYGTKSKAYDEAYDMMKFLTENPERFQEFIAY